MPGRVLSVALPAVWFWDGVFPVLTDGLRCVARRGFLSANLELVMGAVAVRGGVAVE